MYTYEAVRENAEKTETEKQYEAFVNIIFIIGGISIEGADLLPPPSPRL